MNKHGVVQQARQMNFKDPETRALAEEVARREGTSLNGAVKAALREKLERDYSHSSKDERLKRAYSILEQVWIAPIADTRSADEILGYNEDGLPN